MRKVWLVIIIMAMCISCKKEYDHHGRTPLVELNGRFLYYDEIQSVLPLSLSASDSVSFVEQYKLNWMKELLLMDKATHNIPNNAEIDRLVELSQVADSPYLSARADQSELGKRGYRRGNVSLL